LTSIHSLQHPKEVLRLLSRLAALATVVALAGGQLAECQGWLATPEARMACCANEHECPMHKADPHRSAPSLRISQSDADRCCATSEHGDSMPTSVKVTAVDSLALIPVGLSGVVESPAIRFDGVSENPPSPPTSLARHVLLSVFLI
jgi:hypothetical protein